MARSSPCCGFSLKMRKKVSKKKTKKTQKKKKVKEKEIEIKAKEEDKKQELPELDLENIAENFKPDVRIQKKFSLTEDPSALSFGLNLESSIAHIPIASAGDSEDGEGRLYEAKGNYGTSGEQKEENYLEAPKIYQQALPREALTSLTDVKRKTRESRNVEASFTTGPELIGEGKLSSGTKKEDYFIAGQSWEEGKKSEQEKFREEYII